MMTVREALNAFLSSLELTSTQDEDARAQRDRVHEVLKDGLSIAETVFSGSFARHTAIRPLDDIDLFMVLSRKAHSDLLGADPTACLKAIQKVLDEAWSNKPHPILQNRSVRVDFTGTGIGYDVVPAFRDPDHEDVYSIPDRDTSSWISSNPRLHAEYAVGANSRAGDRAKPLVKALKHWNRQFEEPPMRSFHLELMVYRVLDAPPKSNGEGLVTLFEGVARSVLVACPDPAGLGPDIDAGTTEAERVRAQNLLLAAAVDARAAVAAATDGRTEAAHHHWRKVFGGRYPEAGKVPGEPPVASAAVAARAGTDAASKRFG